MLKYKIRNKNKVDENINKPTAVLSNPTTSTKRKPVIIIDAGHGGKDPGTIGNYARTKEKNITLSYAKELAKNLMNEKKYKVYLTRDEDFFIPLDKRVAKSRRKKADLLFHFMPIQSLTQIFRGFRFIPCRKILRMSKQSFWLKKKIRLTL